MKLHFTPYTLEFRYPFKIALNYRTTTPVVITEIMYDGIVGYGEASMPPYLGEDHATVAGFLIKAAKVLDEFKSPIYIETIIDRVETIADGNAAAKASIDIALHDLKGKLENRACYTFWNLKKEDAPYTSITIGMDEPDVVARKIKEAGIFKILKVKLGGDDDKRIIETIRSHTDKPVSVDVNQGWKTKEEALDMIHWLKEKNVLFVEQPLAKNDLTGSAWLSERSPLPVIADESFQRLADMMSIKDCFHGINVKLMKCAGLNEAYKIIMQAKKHGLKVLIGCMSETSCAVSAAAQLSPLADWADLDGPLLIKKDLFEGVGFNGGRLVLNDQPGIGVRRLQG